MVRAGRRARAGRHRAGVVLLMVLVFALLLTGSIATFQRRSMLDSMISKNRENAARAEALARGGVQLAKALLAHDLIQDSSQGLTPLESRLDPWAELGRSDIPDGNGGLLRVQIEDAGSRLNLNALPHDHDQTEPFLQALLEKVIDEMEIPPGEKALYDPDDLAKNLIDWIDPDDLRLQGGPEDAYYQDQDPPYRAPAGGGPLLSLEDLRLIEGYDRPLVEALEPYVTVYPYAPDPEQSGINPNTAEPHVLSLLYYDDSLATYRLASEDVVRAILRVRELDDRLLCPGQEQEICTPISEIPGLEAGTAVFPPLAYTSNVFTVQARAQVGDVERTVEAVLDRSNPLSPELLSWRVR